MELLTTYAWLGPCIAALLGLQIGSFLNVLILRLPKMMQIEWEREIALIKGQDTEHPPFNLFWPRSHCSKCLTPLSFRDLIPVVSYLWLKGRCAYCGERFSARYCYVELLAAFIAAGCTAYYGWTWQAFMWTGFLYVLIALSMIDYDTQLLPDVLTLPLLWCGLIAAALGWTNLSTESAVWGCIAGYMSLWLVQYVFGFLTGKQGIGAGDFKLLAALGAWMGWQALPWIVLVASLLGSLVGIGLRLSARLEPGQAFPFGPFLISSGIFFWLLMHARLTSLIGLQL